MLGGFTVRRTFWTPVIPTNGQDFQYIFLLSCSFVKPSVFSFFRIMLLFKGDTDLSVVTHLKMLGKSIRVVVIT